MDLDLKLDKVIEAIDLVKRLSWGAIPLWFALTLPVLYVAYSKLLPERKADEAEPQGASAGKTGWQTVRKWFSVPKIDKVIVYASLVLFVGGTITLLVDQHHKENIRNNGLRLKQYFTSGKNLALNRNSLIKGSVRIANLSSGDIDDVLDLYPGEFMEVQEDLITLRDSALYAKIMAHCERLLDSYLSNPAVSSSQDIDGLINQSNFFPREVAYKLLVDSPRKYTYCVVQNRSSILVKRPDPGAPESKK